MKKDSIKTHIIAGDFKGKALELPSLEVTRSSKSILKESYFNRLQFDIIGEPFVELFAGSGSIGLEALSRGASRVYFFEKDKNSFEVLKRNISKLDPLRCEAQHADVFQALSGLLKRLETPAYFYVDPPFATREGMEGIYDDMVALLSSIPQSLCLLLTVEHMSELTLPETIGSYTKEKVKKFGKTTLTYYV